MSNDQQARVDQPVTARDLLDSFLRSRAREVTGPTLARDREVIEWFGAFLDAQDRHAAASGQVDELAAHRAARTPDTSDAKIEAKIGADRILKEITDFFGVWLPIEMQATAFQWRSAALVIRLLARWLLRARLVDEVKSREVHHFTQRFAPIADSQRRPGYRPPGSPTRPRWR